MAATSTTKYLFFNTLPTNWPKPLIITALLFTTESRFMNRAANMGIKRMETNKDERSEKLTVQACSLNNSPAAPCK